MTAASTSAPPSTLPGLGAVRAILSTLVALARNPSGAIGLFGVTFFVLVAFVGPTFVPIDTKAKLDKIYQLPSAEYLLGTDYQGRDVFSQIVHGGRDIIIVASTTALITTTKVSSSCARISRRKSRPLPPGILHQFRLVQRVAFDHQHIVFSFSHAPTRHKAISHSYVVFCFAHCVRSPNR